MKKKTGIFMTENKDLVISNLSCSGTVLNSIQKHLGRNLRNLDEGSCVSYKCFSVQASPGAYSLGHINRWVFICLNLGLSI